MTNSRYDVVHNPFGTYKDIDGKNWYETTYPINSVFDAHQHVGTAKARPDSKDKGIVYKDSFIKKYNTIQEITKLDADKRANALVNGSSESVSGLVGIAKYSDYEPIVSGDYNYTYGFFPTSNGSGSWRNPEKDNASYMIVGSNGSVITLAPDSDINNWERDGTNCFIYVMQDSTKNIVEPASSAGWKTDMSTLFPVGTKLTLYYVETLPILSSGNHLMTDIIGAIDLYKSTDTTAALQSTSTDTGTELRQNVLSWNAGQMFKYLDTDDRDNVDLTSENYYDEAKWVKVSKGYDKSWLNRLNEGRPLVGLVANLVDVNSGSSLIPDGNNDVSVTFNKKLIGWKLGVNSKNSGISFSSNLSFSNLGGSYIKNSFTANKAKENLYLVFYTAANQVAQISQPKPITYVQDKCIMSNSYSVYKGAGLTNLLGGIATSDSAVDMESRILENAEIGYDIRISAGVEFNILVGQRAFFDSTFGLEGTKNWSYERTTNYTGTYDSNTDIATAPASWINGVKGDFLNTVPKNSTPILTANTSKASKSFYNLAEQDSSVYDMVFVQELATDTNGVFNASTEFTNLANGTTQDDTGVNVKTVCASTETPFRVHK